MEIRLPPGTFYGNEQHKCTLDGLTLSLSDYVSGVSLSHHVHEYAYISLLLRGSYTEIYSGRSLTYGPLTLVFHPAGEAHADRFHADGGQVFSLEMAPVWLDCLSDRSNLAPLAQTMQGGFPAWLALRLYREFRTPDTAAGLAIQGLAMEILAEFCRQKEAERSPQPPLWLRQVRDMLHEACGQERLLTEIASAVSVHPTHLVRSFRRYYGCTMGEYARRCRIDFACRKLIGSETSLAEIALEAGFYDQSHFCRVFKQQVGISPQAFRARSDVR